MVSIDHAPTARQLAFYGRQVLDALDPSPPFPVGWRFILVTPVFRAKPLAFQDLQGLARRIHADRGDDQLQLQPVRYRFRDGERPCVQVQAEDAGGRVRTLGFAYLGGRPWEALQDELDHQRASAVRMGGR